MDMVKGPDLKILGIVAKLTQNDTKKDVLETEIIALSELSESEVRNRLNELEWRAFSKRSITQS